MSNWNGTILGPPHVRHPAQLYEYGLGSWQSVHENRIYSLNIHCGDNYPDAPPTVQFNSKINLPCVDPRTGKVNSTSALIAFLRVLILDVGRINKATMPVPMEAGEYHGDDSDRIKEVSATLVVYLPD